MTSFDPWVESRAAFVKEKGVRLVRYVFTREGKFSSIEKKKIYHA